MYAKKATLAAGAGRERAHRPVETAQAGAMAAQNT